MQDENDEKVGEMISETEEAPPEETVTEPVEPEKPKEPEHDAVGPGGTCSKCGWVFGDPVKGIAPHIVYFGAARHEPEAPPSPVEVAKKPSGEGACDAVSLSGTCPKCGWNYAEEMKTATPRPHPVF